MIMDSSIHAQEGIVIGGMIKARERSKESIKSKKLLIEFSLRAG